MSARTRERMRQSLLHTEHVIARHARSAGGRALGQRATSPCPPRTRPRGVARPLRARASIRAPRSACHRIRLPRKPCRTGPLHSGPRLRAAAAIGAMANIRAANTPAGEPRVRLPWASRLRPSSCRSPAHSLSLGSSDKRGAGFDKFCLFLVQMYLEGLPFVMVVTTS